jgi:hypothetical protein
MLGTLMLLDKAKPHRREDRELITVLTLSIERYVIQGRVGYRFRNDIQGTRAELGRVLRRALPNDPAEVGRLQSNLLDEWKAAGTEDGDYYNNLDVILLDVPAQGAANLFAPLLAHEVTHHLQDLGGKKITPGTLVHEFQAEYIAYRLLRMLGDADTPDTYKDVRNGSVQDVADWVRSAYAGSIKNDGSGDSMPNVGAASRQINSWVHEYYVRVGSPS